MPRSKTSPPTSYVALLRAVNVAGKNLVAMAELRALLGSLGLADARTLLQSGNALFVAPAGLDAAALEQKLEVTVRERLQVSTDFFVRSAQQWQEIIAANPFPTEARRDPGHLILLTLKAAPSAQAVTALTAAIVGREQVQARGRELFAVYPDGVGRSKLTVALIEKKLGTRATGRNWNTVLKLGALLEG